MERKGCPLAISPAPFSTTVGMRIELPKRAILTWHETCATWVTYGDLPSSPALQRWPSFSCSRSLPLHNLQQPGRCQAQKPYVLTRAFQDARSRFECHTDGGQVETEAVRSSFQAATYAVFFAKTTKSHIRRMGSVSSRMTLPNGSSSCKIWVRYTTSTSLRRNMLFRRRS